MNIKKSIIFAFCILFILMIITNSILSSDFAHLELCEEPDCPLCRLIVFAIDFSKNINLIFINTLYLNLIIPLIQILLFRIYHITKKNTLVDLKIIQNN